MKDWAAEIEEQERSGKSVSEYCLERGIRPNTFYNQKSKQSRFARVVTGKKVELEFDSGLRLRVSAEDLKTVLTALR